MTGRFVVLEGGDGSGKSTQRDLLVEWLRGRDLVVVETGEPGGTDLGFDLRRLLLDGTDVSPRAEALLMAADRAQHTDRKIRPALARGRVRPPSWPTRACLRAGSSSARTDPRSDPVFPESQPWRAEVRCR